MKVSTLAGRSPAGGSCLGSAAAAAPLSGGAAAVASPAGVPAAAGDEEVAPLGGPRRRRWSVRFGSECGAQAEDLPPGGAGNGGVTGNRSVPYPDVRRQVPESAPVGTRKMVNYAWRGRSQRKLWWRSEAVLTCKSIVRAGYRGERLIEPSSSWFPPKFPSG